MSSLAPAIRGRTTIESIERLRLSALYLLLYLGIQGSFGLAWDLFWHARVGRDGFLSPPHLLIYSAVALSGLTCLGMVLYESWLYRQQPDVLEATTIPVLGGAFHAMLGFVMAGFGNLGLLIAAPLDNYWHILYGLDVSIWAPFHMMGLLAGQAVSLGVLYAVIALHRRTGKLETIFWLTLAGFFANVSAIAQPAVGRVPLLALGSAQIILYPVLLTVAVVLVLVAAEKMHLAPWGALKAALAASVLLLARGAFAMGSTALLVAWQGYGYRVDGIPVANPLGLPLGLLAAALLFTGLDRALAQRGMAEFPRLVLAGSGAGIALMLLYQPWSLFVGALPPLTFVLTLPFIVVAAALATWLGWHLALALRTTTR